MKKLLAVSIMAIMLLSFTLLPASAALPPLVFGDVIGYDGVDITDATAVQRYVANIDTLYDTALYAADVNADEKVSVVDATLIQQKVAGLIDVFPAGDSCYIDLYAEALVADYNSSTATVGQEVTFRAIASGGPGPLMYEFYINGDLRQEKSEQNIYKCTFTQKGTYEIEFIVTSKAGLTRSESIYLTVNDPVESGWIVVNNVYHLGFYDTYTTFEAVACDGYGPYEYRFSLYKDAYPPESFGTLVEETEFSGVNSFTVTKPLENHTHYTLFVEVKNDRGMSVVEEYEFDFELPPPA
ncbi:MAG: hypothetical protein IJE16_02115 [Ruminococcus sp.]|nr:hypothetical protein [Ruminococcus sp.]